MGHLHIHTLHPSKREKNSSENKEVDIRTRFFYTSIKMWLPWQRHIISNKIHLCAHLHIHTLHPSKRKKNSSENKEVVIRTRFFLYFHQNVVTMATPHHIQ